jgi:tRNA 2-thiouridine synthesizing protein B
MATLHTVNKSPFDRNSLDACVRLAVKGSAVLMIEDGVYGAIKGTAKSGMVEAAMGNVKFYVLGEDLAARGIAKEKLIGGIETVDYAGFVKLVCDFETTQSWL